MGILDWLKNLIAPPARRDVSRLGGEDADLDEVSEAVDLSGGPLKPNHRRRALRDRRLVPKKKPVLGGLLRRGKRPRLMSRGEAGRLFSDTMRTRDRNVRDLLADEEQLARLGLPVWKTEEDLAGALAISPGELRHYSVHRERERVAHYVTFAIPKRSGGERTIMAPKRRLKAIQRKLHELLVSKLPVSEHAHAFRRGRSIRTGAEPHVGRAVVLRMDLTDFFPTIHVGRVRGLLVACGYGHAVATALAVLMTEARRQPVEIEGTVFHVPVGPRHAVQGAPTSPGLANALVLRLDRRLAGLARSLGFVYTRYADDLAFSSGEAGSVAKLRYVVRRIVSEEGFTVNDAKTRVMKRGSRQVVTGVTVNDRLGLSRRERRILRAQAHRIAVETSKGTVDPAERARFEGKLAYLAMLNPEQAAALRPESRSA